jgi:hypothetical protein
MAELVDFGIPAAIGGDLRRTNVNRDKASTGAVETSDNLDKTGL